MYQNTCEVTIDNTLAVATCTHRPAHKGDNYNIMHNAKAHPTCMQCHIFIYAWYYYTQVLAGCTENELAPCSYDFVD